MKFSNQILSVIIFGSISATAEPTWVMVQVDDQFNEVTKPVESSFRTEKIPGPGRKDFDILGLSDEIEEKLNPGLGFDSGMRAAYANIIESFKAAFEKQKCDFSDFEIFTGYRHVDGIIGNGDKDRVVAVQVAGCFDPQPDSILDACSRAKSDRGDYFSADKFLSLLDRCSIAMDSYKNPNLTTQTLYQTEHMKGSQKKAKAKQ